MCSVSSLLRHLCDVLPRNRPSSEYPARSAGNPGVRAGTRRAGIASRRHGESCWVGWEPMRIGNQGGYTVSDVAVGTSHPTPAGSPFPPIADYAFLSDCEVSALVASSGNIEWMCLPRMDGPSVFAAMLDRDAGWFRLGPADVVVPAGRLYLPGTLILETTWGTPAGWAVVRDVLL